MKEFFRSYNNEVLKPSLNWSKNHWKGLVVFTVVIYGVELGIVYGTVYRDVITEKIEDAVDSVKEKFHKG